MPDPNSSKEIRTYAPPLSFKALTPLYDLVISVLTRENKWRQAFAREIAPLPNDNIVDIGSGTGSLAPILHKMAPLSHYLGIDPDADAANRAKKKNAQAGSNAQFKVGFFSANHIATDAPPNKIISSFVFHQVPLLEKKRIIKDIFDVLPQDGAVYIADYGYQRSALMRVLFRLTVQTLDGIEDTQPNAEGIIPKILEYSGFDKISEVSTTPTLTGSISIYSAKSRNER